MKRRHQLQWNVTGFVTTRRMEAMLYGVGRKHNDEKTLKRILDDGAK